VRALAEELRTLAPDLADALRSLESQASDLPAVAAALADLRAGAVYRWLAVALLAEEIADAGSDDAASLDAGGRST
jgi:hypothetical protein